MANDWEKTGKVEFLSKCKLHLDQIHVLRQDVHELLTAVVKGRVKATHASNALAELVQMKESLVNVIADLLLLLDFETQVEEDRQSRSHYLDLIVCCANKVVNETLLKERLDFDTSGDAHIIPNKKTAQTKFIKLKTRLFYKQQKFNLYREESEGYAKLITELKDHESNGDPVVALQLIKSLIGCFNLDPNRVLDVILECFECGLDQHAFYVHLICDFLDNSATLSQILAFKFNFYQNDVSLFTPSSLYEVTATLIKHGLLQLDDLWNYLLPTDLDIKEFYDKELVEEKKNANKAAIVMNKVEEPSDDLKQHQLKVDNQKMGLCFYLIKVADWDNSLRIFQRLPTHYVLSQKKLAVQLCKYLQFVLDPFYRDHSGLPKIVQMRIRPLTYSFGETIKTARTISDFRELVLPVLDQLGPFVFYDPLLITKLIRILKSILSKYGDQVRYDVLNCLNETILPAISFMDSNCSLSEELWHLLRCFPYPVRYRLYSCWREELKIALAYRNRGNVMRKIRYIMKRLSKENVKMFGRQIGKLTHTNPSLMFDYILSQIQVYDNLIGPVVDSFKYLTSVSYDVLICCVIETLANPAKQKKTGNSISPWMLSLSNFCGAVVKKYPVELPGLLQFIANQLKTKESLDLIILKEIIQKMTGIEAPDEMTEDQIAALSGGELLKNEGGYFNQVRNTRKSSARLKEALLESNLAMPLCILMAQQRNCIIFHDLEGSYLKLVSKLYDQCQQTLVQYGSFLASNLSIDDYIGHLPSMQKLLQDFYLSSDVVFYLTRPMIVHNINQRMEELLKEKTTAVMIKDNNSDVSGHPPEDKETRAYIQAWDIVTESIVNTMGNEVHRKLWGDLNPKFFMSFWTLSSYDLEVPLASYEKEVERLKGQIQATEEKDMPLSKKKKEVERCRSLLDKLLDEQHRQEEHVRRVRHRLDKEKSVWFGPKVHKMEMTTQFLQHCLIPRCVFTANDALYCAEFVHLLHTIKTPNFSTLICYDRIFCDISYTMSMCTEDGANNYGRFLCGLLRTVMSWHKDRDVFERECAKYPGFVSKFSETDPMHVDYEDYRHVCHKWHYRLTKAFIVCLDSGDYMQIRNSLIVLTKVLPYLPVMTSFANVIEKHVEQIRMKEKDARPDLYALATGYSGQLKLRKGLFIPESEFHRKEGKKDESIAVAPSIESSNNNNNSSIPTVKLLTTISSSTINGSADAVPAVIVNNHSNNIHQAVSTSVSNKEQMVKKESRTEVVDAIRPADLSSQLSSKSLHRESRSGKEASSRSSEESIERTKSDRPEPLIKSTRRTDKFASRTLERINNSNKIEGGRSSAGNSPKPHARSSSGGGSGVGGDENESSRDRDHRRKRDSRAVDDLPSKEKDVDRRKTTEGGGGGGGGMYSRQDSPNLRSHGNRSGRGSRKREMNEDQQQQLPPPLSSSSSSSQHHHHHHQQQQQQQQPQPVPVSESKRRRDEDDLRSKDRKSLNGRRTTRQLTTVKGKSLEDDKF